MSLGRSPSLFFFNDTATTEIYTLSLHDALPIYLQAPASWDDLLNPAYKNMLQMADARTSGTAVTRIFSILQVNNRAEYKAFAYMKKLRQNAQLYTTSRAGRTLPVGLEQGAVGRF